MLMLQDRVQILTDELALSAGLDPLSDRFKVGALAACKDLINIEWEESPE